MPAHKVGNEGIDPTTRLFYHHALTALLDSDIPFLVGGGYAMAYHTGTARQTKDFDIFVKPADFERVLNLFALAGYPTEITFPSWLGKAIQGTDNIDVIFNSGNGLARVDETWFVPVVEAELFGLTLQICPVEEMIWSKATIMGRERFDGADIAHLLHACGRDLDWRRLLARFDTHWRVLLSHLILFGYIYPAERAQIPDWVMHKLLGAMQQETNSPSQSARICRGTILAWDQYLFDVECCGYHDARLPPLGSLSKSDIAHFTAILSGAKRPKLRQPIDTRFRPMSADPIR